MLGVVAVVIGAAAVTGCKGGDQDAPLGDGPLDRAQQGAQRVMDPRPPENGGDDPGGPWAHRHRGHGRHRGGPRNGHRHHGWQSDPDRDHDTQQPQGPWAPDDPQGEPR